MSRRAAKFVRHGSLLGLALGVCFLSAAGRAAERALAEPTVAPTVAPAGDADLAARCFEALLPAAAEDDAAWCDVQIDELNRRFDRGPRENTELLAAYHNRAVLRMRAGELELADADLAAALQLQPQRAELLLTRGNLRLAERRFVEALEDYNRAIELSSGRQPAWFGNRALALRALGEVEAAALDARRAVAEPSGAAAAGPAGRAAPGN